MFTASFKSFGQLTPRAHRMMPATAALALSLAATHRMVDRVHRHTANMRSPAQPTTASRFATRDIHMLHVADLSDRRVGVFMNPPNLARRHPDQRIARFAIAENGLLTGAPSHLAASTW